MDTVWFATLFSLFIWWFSTGVILLVVRRADRKGGFSHRLAVYVGLPVLLLGFVAIAASRSDNGVGGAYTGFVGALAVWGWIELSFLTGTITGPSRAPLTPGAMGQDRFCQAWNTVAHHELLLALGLLVIVAMTLGHDNTIALFTYLVLFMARISAKLNLFFGVPRINVEFVPRPMVHLASYFRQQKASRAFPVAITTLSFAVACFLQQLWTAANPAETVRHALLTALVALALLEHWLMVLPLPDAKLWRWMLPAPAAPVRHLTPPSMKPNER